MPVSSICLSISVCLSICHSQFLCLTNTFFFFWDCDKGLCVSQRFVKIKETNDICLIQ